MQKGQKGCFHSLCINFFYFSPSNKDLEIEQVGFLLVGVVRSWVLFICLHS